MAAGDGGGAAAGPFAGMRVPREGEHATVERLGDGALLAEHALLRGPGERFFPRTVDRQLAVVTAVSWHR